MEIPKTSYTSSTSKASKKKKKSESGFSAALSESAGSHSTSETSGSSNIDSILSLQEVSLDEEKKRQGKNYGAQLLDELDKIKNAVLSGRISMDQLTALKHKIEAARPSIEDMQLNQILNEIELRAKVEIAKYKKYGPAA